jgi:hypothetical protein
MSPSPIKRAQNLVRKARHAGPAWTARALWQRGQKKILGLPAFRASVDTHLRASKQDVRDAVNFNGCPNRDLAVRFVDKPIGRHFLDGARAVAAVVQDRFPDHVQRTIAIADDVGKLQFDLLGRSVSFHERVDWFWIPETNNRWPVAHVDSYEHAFYNRADRPGDIKYPWELNRHQYFLTLAKAYLYTQDPKYLRVLASFVDDWDQKNPFRTGINWYSALEIGIRLIAWTNTAALLRTVPNADRALIASLMYGAYQHARYLNHQLTTDWLVANNHLVGESSALFGFAAAFPEFHEAAKWRVRARRILAAALEQQIFADGVNHEQATGYHRFVLDFALYAHRLAALNNSPLPQRLMDRVAAMIRYEANAAPRDGFMPQVGDCDDGRGLWLSESAETLDYRGWLAYGAAHLGLADQLPRSDVTEEALWLGGAALANQPESHRALRSVAFGEGGHYVLRAGAEEDAYVFVRCGSFGLGGGGSSAHSHADLLAPIVKWRGRDLFVDAGTYGYMCATRDRDWHRSGEAHNTCLPVEVDQGEMLPLWNWHDVPSGQWLRFDAAPRKTELVGRLVNRAGVQLDRTLTLIADPLQFAFSDRLSHRGNSATVCRLHLAPDLAAEETEAGTIRITDGADFVVVLRYEGYVRAAVRTSWYSPRYGVRQRNACIELSTEANPAEGRVLVTDDTVRTTAGNSPAAR